MHQVENYYSLLGVAKSASDAELRQAYEVQLQSLRARTSPDTQTQAQQHKALLDTALQTLLNPEKRRRHDERLDWFVARGRLQSERTLQANIRLKQEQEKQQQRERDALAAAKDAAIEVARRAMESDIREAERARVEAGAAERFRQLREERLPFMDTQPAQLQHVEEADTPPEPAPVPPPSSEETAHYLRSLAKKIALGAVLLVVFFALAYWLLRHDAPPPRPSAAATVAPAAAPDPLPQASNPPSDPATADSAAQAGAVEASAANPNAAPDAAATPTPAERAKAAELLQYQKVLRRVEREHPELNPGHPSHRDDWIAFVAARVKVHQKAGYPRSKALEIAVRDLETRELAQRMLDKQRGVSPPKPEAPVRLDPGQHQGFDPKCRWVTPEQWSCK